MKVEDIVSFEDNPGGEIHLVKDRIFWQAWEKSAHLFVHNFRAYKVHSRFVQKVSLDLVWLGFPESALPGILDLARTKNFRVDEKSVGHCVISGIPALGGFDEWKSSVVGSCFPGRAETPAAVRPKASFGKTKQSEFLLFRLLFDFSVYVLKTVPKFGKPYRFSLGERIASNVMNLSETVNLYVNHERRLDFNDLSKLLLTLRFQFRLANELHQVSLKQWMYVNQNIDEILRIVSPESAVSRNRGACIVESSIPPSS